MSGNGGSPDVLITIYRQLFCVSAYSHVNLVKDNDFTNFASYMLQKVCNSLFIEVYSIHIINRVYQLILLVYVILILIVQEKYCPS